MTNSQLATRNPQLKNMKLRCVHNSIRIRIKKSELLKLDSVGVLTETVSFGGGTQLAYGIVIDAQHEKGCATFENSLITIHIPIAIAENWMHSNEVGIEFYDAIDDGELLHILIEKDFPCVDREDEDKSDTFTELATKKPDVC